MLMSSHRHTAQDLALWAEYEAADRINGCRDALTRKVDQSIEVMKTFVASGPAYCGISWGKDSTVLAHLAWRAGIGADLAWVCVRPICNPDCEAVERAFLARYPTGYHRVEVWCQADRQGWHASGTLEQGFREVIARTGASRHISGVRGDESGDRMRRMRQWGFSTANTCAPLGWWTAQDVYSYLAHHDLPVHSAYAMLGGGRWERDQLRVASLGGRRGDGFGRREWEIEYYGDVLRRLEHNALYLRQNR